MTDHGFARVLAVWAREPAGFAWSEVKPDYIPRSIDDIREWAQQDCRDAGIMGDALDDAFDRIDSVCVGAEMPEKLTMTNGHVALVDNLISVLLTEKDVVMQQQAIELFTMWHARRVGRYVGEQAVFVANSMHKHVRQMLGEPE